MEYLGELVPYILVLGLALLAYVLRLVHKIVRDTSPSEPNDNIPLHSQVPGAPPGSEQIPANQRIYEITSRLEGFYNIAAHPKELDADPVYREGVDLLSSLDTSQEDVVRFAVGDHVIVSCMALDAMRIRKDSAETRREILSGIGTFAPWSQFFALAYLVEKTPATERLIGRVLANTTMYMEDRLSRVALEELIKRRHELGEALEFEPSDTWFLNPDGSTALRRFLDRIDPSLGLPLRDSLGEQSPDPVPPHWPSGPGAGGDVLKSTGRVWTGRDVPQADDLFVYPELEQQVAEILAMITAPRPQSVLLTGASGVGKATLKRVLASRLIEDDWTIFVAGHSDILAGQMYIGQLEQRLNRIIERLQSDRKTVWFITDIDRLTVTGTHHYSDFSAMDALLPHIADGSLRVVADIQPSPLDRLLQKQPSIPNAMAVLEARPPVPETALEIARWWIAGKNLQVSDEVLREVWDLAQQYLSDRAAPGNVMDLLKSTQLRLAATVGDGQSVLAAEDVLVTLARQTGLPVGLLDPKRDLDLNHLEKALTERVIGQQEAVQCLVDRVAMMKAGLTDPTRPYGVFLFAGPTGTGKTEIAKSLATWLFGSANRLIRIDMSELRTPESLDRLLGSADGTETESLADQVRKQPFSVILFDEFEKAHPNVWDLFLQIFDDARITDHRGRTASFRHAIIILTANLGATIPTGFSIGFGSSAKRFDINEVHAAIAKVFRREFINRLDRVIVFRPLDRDLMRQILSRELRDVFERRGLKGRPWAVEWDESAIAFLLEKGFTPDLGARPLKRAVERYLLSPLATTIVHHQVPEGDQFLFISCGREALRVEFVDPDSDDGGQESFDQAGLPPTEAAADGIDLARSILLKPLGSPQNLAALGTSLEGIELQVDSEEWRHRRHALFAKIDQTEFWSSPERFSVLGLIETIDRIERGVERARGLAARIERQAGRDSLPQRVLALLAQNVFLLATACDDVTKNRPREAFLLVEARSEGVHEIGEALSFARRIADMYEAWAKNRNMRLTQLFRSNPRSEIDMRALYSVSGYGAYSILEPECGLHIRERPGETRRSYRHDTTRVTVVPQPDEPLPSSASKAISLVERVTEKTSLRSSKIVRRYREEPSPLVRDVSRGWRTGRIDLVLGGNFDLF